MNDLHAPEDVAAYNERSLKTLERAIAHSQGQFSLILVRCNYGRLQKSMRRHLQEQCSIPIRELVLNASTTTLLASIKAEIAAVEPSALMVLGLEWVTTIDDLLRHTNRVRDQFRDFSFPLVLWVTETVLQKFIWLAPDFKSFAIRSIKFEMTTSELIDFLQQTTVEAIASLRNATANNRKNLEIEAIARASLESAQRDLQMRGVSLDAKLKDDLQLILSLDDSLRDSYSPIAIRAAL